MEKPSASNVKVIARFRPMNQKELAMEKNICVLFPNQQTVTLKPSQGCEGGQPHTFVFDRVFDVKTTQKEIYDFGARPVVESVLEGFNGTIFAYGQTSSGKTFTMQGYDINDENLKGVIPRMVQTVFHVIRNSPDQIEFTVKVSIVEIYMEKIADLLDETKTNLKVREDKQRGIYIEDVTEVFISEEKEVFDLINQANATRSVAATNMNDQSSRSHLIFMLSIHQDDKINLSAKTGKLFLVDLAGSEKIAKTGAEGQTLKEAQQINKSLSCLGNVINALTDGKSSHIPYRDSKLTRIMSESLGGNARTTLFVTCSPSIFNDAETLSTLRFGMRAKSIKNKPKINRELTVAELTKMLEDAEAKIVQRNRRIVQLEEFIKSTGHQIPKENTSVDLSIPKAEESEEQVQLKDTLVVNEMQEERIKSLELEIETERQRVLIQSEKLNLLRQDYSTLNTKCNRIEKENNQYLDKVADLTIQKKDLEDSVHEKDIQVQGCENLISSLKTELEILKSNHSAMKEQLDEKEFEIQKLSRKAGTLNFASRDMLTANAAQNQKPQTNPKDLVEEKIKQCKGSLAAKLQEISAIDENLLKCENPNDLIAFHTKQNAILKEALAELMKKYEKEVEDLVLNSGDKSGYEVEKSGLQQKVLELQKQCQEEKEKNIKLQSGMAEGNKNLLKKIQSLETNLENLSRQFNKATFENNRLKTTNDQTEKKLQRREQKIKDLESKLEKTRDHVQNYKEKCETLKMVLENSVGGNQMAREMMMLQEIPTSNTELPSETEIESSKMKEGDLTMNQSILKSKMKKTIRGGQSNAEPGGSQVRLAMIKKTVTKNTAQNK